MASVSLSQRVARLRAFARTHLYLLVAPSAALVLFLALQQIPFFRSVDNQTIDQRFQFRQSYDPPGSAHLLLVGIDEPSIKAFDRWPWSRAVHGDFLQLLSPAKPKVIGWDILFTESNRDDAKGDAHLAESAPGVTMVTGSKLDRQSSPADPEADAANLTKPLPKVTGDIRKIAYGAEAADFPYASLAHASFSGFVDSDPSKLDGIRRKMPLVVRVGDKVYPTLDTQILMQWWELRPKDVRVHLGQSVDFHTLDGVVSVPIDEGGEIAINYRTQSSFRQIDYSTLYGQLARTYIKNEPWPEKWPKVEGQILLVGQVATGLTDFGPNPFSGITPLTLTHLNVLNEILLQDFLSEAPWTWIVLGWLPIAYLSLWFATRRESILAAIAVPVVLVALYTVACFAVFWRYSLILPVFWPVGSLLSVHLGSIILRWLAEQKSKQAIKAVFSSFVSEGIMNELLRSPESMKLGGASKPVTIFFSDIRSFSSFSEKMGEQELIRQLNEYFVRMVGVVMKYEGSLHKFIGDAIMAVWSDVVSHDLGAEAKNAVRAALEMRMELIELNKLRREQGLFDFHIGMGLNHGTVVVGNIGAEGKKLEFTVIGDAVNLASRLEGVTKQFHTDFVIGESVRAFLGDEFVLRSIGLLTVKGKTIPIRAFEVFEEVAKPNGLVDPAWVRLYEKGFDAYLAREFKEAIACFEECLKTRPDDFCTNEYHKACQELLLNPPDEKWDGVLKLDSK